MAGLIETVELTDATQSGWAVDHLSSARPSYSTARQDAMTVPITFRVACAWRWTGAERE